VLRLVVVEWKFSELDSNHDSVIDHRELDKLGRLVKKLVRPVSCATSFHTRCDVDFDSSLTLHEWRTCFDDGQTTTHSTVDGSYHTGSEIKKQEAQLSLTNRQTLVHVVFLTLRTYVILFDALSEGDPLELSG